ncbi:21758_t:CDS:2 [Rhizophagus irregularis]|nr:21758_t:CDS:2 [Rhizophagus irregularis]
MRLKKWFQYFTDKEKTTITTDLTTIILSRKRSMCNVLEYGEHKVIYKRYASLYFVAGIDWDENELYTLERIMPWMNYLWATGELQEPNKKAVIRHIKSFEQTCQLDILTRNLEETIK